MSLRTRQRQHLPLQPKVFAQRRDDDLMILPLRQTRYSDDADCPDAFDLYRKAAAGKYEVIRG